MPCCLCKMSTKDETRYSNRLRPGNMAHLPKSVTYGLYGAVPPPKLANEVIAMNRSDFVTVDAKILHGTPVFKGTRVPIETLFDYLADGESINEFLDDFPSVTKEQVEMALEYSKLQAAA